MAAKSANPTRPGRCEGEERKKALGRRRLANH